MNLNESGKTTWKDDLERRLGKTTWKDWWQQERLMTPLKEQSWATSQETNRTKAWLVHLFDVSQTNSLVGVNMPLQGANFSSHEMKIDCYIVQQVKCQINGWSCYNMAVEVGAKGYLVAYGLIKAEDAIRMRGQAQKNLIRDVSMEVQLFKIAVLIIREGVGRRNIRT